MILNEFLVLLAVLGAIRTIPETIRASIMPGRSKTEIFSILNKKLKIPGIPQRRLRSGIHSHAKPVDSANKYDMCCSLWPTSFGVKQKS